jgi:hypothetical protein
MRNLFCITRYIVFSVLVFSCFQVDGQRTPNQMLRGVYSKMMKVNDYSVEASIRANIPFIKIFPVNAVIYFKQPDKFKVESKNIAILPRQGFSDLSKIIHDSTSYTAVFTGKELNGKSLTQITSLIPSVDTGDLVLAKFWIDASSNLVLKSQLTTRSNGTMLIEYFYGTQAIYGLPDKMIFTVDVKKFKVPKIIATDIQNPDKAIKRKTKTSGKGVILISMKNYKINTGLKGMTFK